MADQARQVDEKTVSHGDASELMLCVSVVVQSSPLRANSQRQIIDGAHRWINGFGLTSLCLEPASPWRVLPYRDSLRSSSLLCSGRCQLQAHWESLGKGKKNGVSTSCIQHGDAEGRQTEFHLNQWKAAQAACPWLMRPAV